MNELEFRTNLNLLPAAYRRRVLVRRGLTLWACVAIVGLSAASIVVWQAERSLAAVLEERSRFERMYAPTRVMSRELASMKQQMKDLEFEERAAEGLEDDRPALAILGIVGRAAAACDGRLHVRVCELARAPAGRSQQAGRDQLLTIKGAALGVDSIATFSSVLSDSQMFRRVEFANPITNEAIGDLTGHVFHFECIF